jgi:Recombinase
MAKQAGRHVHGRVPYGHRSERGVLEPDPERAEVVRRIFRDAADGYTPGWIARRLERDGVPTPQGAAKGWNQMGVRTILGSPAYTGERHGVKRTHPAIVSRRAFNEVQAILDSRRRGI